MMIEPLPEPSDEEVAKRVQQGDLQSFGALVTRYEEKMTRYARRFLADGDEIKDIVQDIFVKAYMNIKSFDATRRFSPWIYRIAHNEFVNALRKKKGKETIPLFDFDTLFPHLVAHEDTEATAERTELKHLLEEGLTKLDPKYREPLVLYYFEDLGYKEIADILKIPTSTVGVRLQRGKAMLRKTVEPYT